MRCHVCRIQDCKVTILHSRVHKPFRHGVIGVKESEVNVWACTSRHNPADMFLGAAGVVVLASPDGPLFSPFIDSINVFLTTTSSHNHCGGLVPIFPCRNSHRLVCVGPLHETFNAYLYHWPTRHDPTEGPVSQGTFYSHAHHYS